MRVRRHTWNMMMVMLVLCSILTSHVGLVWVHMVRVGLAGQRVRRCKRENMVAWQPTGASVKKLAINPWKTLTSQNKCVPVGTHLTRMCTNRYTCVYPSVHICMSLVCYQSALVGTRMCTDFKYTLVRIWVGTFIAQ